MPPGTAQALHIHTFVRLMVSAPAAWTIHRLDQLLRLPTMLLRHAPVYGPRTRKLWQARPLVEYKDYGSYGIWQDHSTPSVIFLLA
jgi:hypothetical protein